MATWLGSLLLVEDWNHQVQRHLIPLNSPAPGRPGRLRTFADTLLSSHEDHLLFCFVFPVGPAGSLSGQLHILWPHPPGPPGLLQLSCLQAALLRTVHGFPLLHAIAQHHRGGHLPVSRRQAAKASRDDDRLVCLPRQVPLRTLPQPCIMGLQALIGLYGHMDSTKWA